MAYENSGSAAKEKNGGQAAYQAGAEMASNAADQAKKLGCEAAAKADSVLSSFGEGISKLGATISDSAPNAGTVGAAVGSLGGGLQSGGEYLTAHGVGDITKDLTNVVRRYPLASMWIGMGMGVLLGKALSKK